MPFLGISLFGGSQAPQESSMLERAQRVRQAIMDRVLAENENPNLMNYFELANSQWARDLATAQGLDTWNLTAAADMTGIRVGDPQNPTTTREFSISATDIDQIEARWPETKDHISMRDGQFYMTTRFQPYESCRIAEGASFNEVVYDGKRQQADPLVLRGRYSNVRVEQIGNIDVVVDDNAYIAKLDVSSLEARLTIRGNATINHLDASHAHLTVVNTSSNSTVNRADFTGTERSPMIIAPNSNLRGTWNNVTMDHAILRDVKANGRFNNLSMSHIEPQALQGFDMRGSTINKFTLRDMTPQALAALNLSGVNITDMTVNGRLIESREQLAQLGITVDTNTVISVSPQARMAAVTAQSNDMGLGQGLMAALTGGDGPTAPRIEAPQIAAPEGTSVTLANVSTTDGLDIWAKRMTVTHEERVETKGNSVISGGVDVRDVTPVSLSGDAAKAARGQQNTNFAESLAAAMVAKLRQG